MKAQVICLREILSVICALVLATPAFAGNIDSPAAPSDDAGRLYTLEQAYDKLHDGTNATKQSGGFNESAAGLASTMKTLDNVGVIGTYAGSTYGIPKTGQTTSYTDYDDGYYEKGLPTSGARYTDNTDGTITDNATGLMWVQSGYADINTTPATDYTADGSWRKYTWANAILYCERLNLAGYTDWRLPNIKELQSIVNYGRANPSIGENTSETPWTNSKISYDWSSTTYPGFTGIARYVDFFNGNVGYDSKGISYYVRAVRGGQ